MAFTKTPMTEDVRKQKKREASLRHYYAHYDEVRAQQNARDPEKRRADQRARRLADPEKYQAYGRAEQLRRRQQKPWLASFHACRKRAKQKGMEFTLTYEWAIHRYTGKCEMTGLLFEVREVAGKPGPRPHSVSIDKIDQTKGYTPENCRFVLNAVNTLRGSGSDADVMKIMQALVERSPN